jgi:hypothetical protein
MACQHDAWFSWCANSIPVGCSKIISWSRRCQTCGMRETTFQEPVEYDLPPEMLPIADEPADVILVNEDGTTRVLFSAEDGVPN